MTETNLWPFCQRDQRPDMRLRLKMRFQVVIFGFRLVGLLVGGSDVGAVDILVRSKMSLSCRCGRRGRRGKWE